MSIVYETDKYNNTRSYFNGKLHSDGDSPAMVCANGDTYWYRNGLAHRDGDEPALEFADGYKEWYLHGKLHRDGDLPAAICTNGSKTWYRNGKLHRDGDLHAIENNDNDANRGKYWYKNNVLHRDGYKPAIELENGIQRWYKYGRQYTKEEIDNYYSLLTTFGRLCLRKIRIKRLRRVRWIRGELLCMRAKGNYSGGQDYHKMADYFNKL